jgi:hypothetical protein
MSENLFLKRGINVRYLTPEAAKPSVWSGRGYRNAIQAYNFVMLTRLINCPLKENVEQ